MACALTRQKLTEVVCESIQRHLNVSHAVTAKTLFFDNLFLSTDGKARLFGLVKPDVEAVLTEGCTLNKIAIEDFEDADRVGDVVDAFAEDLGIGDDA